jgi:2,3-bisphosphoglycerate-dependent phosphoglycerate mutase
MRLFHRSIRSLLMIAILGAFLQAFLPLANIQAAQEDALPTTIIVVRHAEKSSEPGDDPNLSSVGKKRAKRLAQMLGSSDISAIYTSQFKRTRDTAQPLAASLDITPTQLDVFDISTLVNRITTNNTGQKVLVVGHSNTVPDIIRALGGENPPLIDENEYDNFFVVTVYKTGKATLLRLKYK